MSAADRADGPAVSRPALFAYTLAVVAIVLDQLTKYWIVHVYRLSEGASVAILPFFSLTGVANRGVSYGLLQSGGELGRWGLVAFSLFVAGALAIWGRRLHRPMAAAAVGLIIGGAVGNAVDRARTGRVIDFLDFSALHFPWVFNLADSCITVGVALLILDGLLAPGSGDRASPPPAHSPSEES